MVWKNHILIIEFWTNHDHYNIIFNIMIFENPIIWIFQIIDHLKKIMAYKNEDIFSLIDKEKIMCDIMSYHFLNLIWNNLNQSIIIIKKNLNIRSSSWSIIL